MKIGNREKTLYANIIEKELRKYEWITEWSPLETKNKELLIVLRSQKFDSAFKITSAGMAPRIKNEVKRIALYLKDLDENGMKVKK